MSKPPPRGALWAKPPAQTDTDAEPPSCALDRPLGDCTLQRAGCDSLYAVLVYMHPPLSLIATLVNQPAPLPTDWLEWLDRVRNIPYRPQP